MPRNCQVSGCKERGRAFEVWVTPVFTIGVWLCKPHHEEGVRLDSLIYDYTEDPEIAFELTDAGRAAMGGG